MNTGMAGRGRQDQGAGDEPPFARVRLEGAPHPVWTLDSSVGDVLLRGARPPEQVPLSECLVRVGCRAADIGVDVRMDDVIREPELYIPDADMRARVLNLPECQTCALVCKVVPQLERNGIASVLQWGGAGNAVAKRAVRNAVADDGLWNTTRCLLDAAFSAAKDADARERAERKRIGRKRKIREMEEECNRIKRERVVRQGCQIERIERAVIECEMQMELYNIAMEKQNDFNRIKNEVNEKGLIKSKRIGGRELRELRERQSNVKCCVSFL
ncbi:hypothetical protein, conserved in T. vivax [Trypanosoma vivax Y486]|uniref:Uncharacterized protein n=1 Tax=Trypanosoma vivax (strain Y486) TaxID=1055687 RepID=F9WMK7_TRYVY|nr:hypothetical protein, conserved in T. vivax [Trypanosoma vivax Y486]|eukprot:CCD18764.1 hypothetical protein, conserved in T. vivax [Trypanosoma vivax Y486]